jgi:hypothetical protein
VVDFLADGRVRLTYSFDSPEQVEDWFEYPREGARGKWEERGGSLVGLGRMGLRHSWRFRGSLTATAVYRKSPSGRLHLFDTGQGRGAAETDFKAVYLGKERSPAVVGRKAPSGRDGTTTIVFGVTEGTLVLAATEEVFRGTVPEESAVGYFGVFCWGREVVIESLELLGEIDLEWASGELARLAAIRAVEAGAGQDTSGTPLIGAAGRFPWPFDGPIPAKQGRGGDPALEVGDVPFRAEIGATSWSDYGLEGWIFLPPGGRAIFSGRSNPRVLACGCCSVEFLPGKIALEEKGGPDEGKKEFPVAQVQAGQLLRFRIEWLRDLVTVEVGGAQVVRSKVKCPATGNLVISGSGQGTEVGGLKMRLLANPSASRQERQNRERQ